MDKNNINFDEDTNIEHIAPIGMETHTRRNNGKGKWYANLRMRHFIIAKHQETFPDLKEQMRTHPNPSAVYSAFLAILPLETSSRYTPDEIETERKAIYKAFKLI